MTKAEAKELFLEPKARKILEELRRQLDGITAIQCESGNWNYSPYMMGLANGLLMAQSLANGSSDVKFLSTPTEWLQDRNAGHDESTDAHLLMEVAKRELVFKESDETTG